MNNYNHKGNLLLSVFSVELAFSLLPIWFLLLLGLVILKVGLIYHVINGMAFFIALYQFGTVIALLVGKWKSKQCGLKRFTVLPISPCLIRFLLGKRVQLPNAKYYFMLHIRTDQVGDPRTFIRQLQDDIQIGFAIPDVVYIGNTYAQLGASVTRTLSRYANVQEISGVITHGVQWFVTKSKIESIQMKMFGRKFRIQEDTRNAKNWRIFVVNGINSSSYSATLG